MNINIKKLTPTAQLPTQGHEYDAGYDLRADIKEIITIPPHTNVFIGTGLAMEIPQGFFGGIFARSGLACKSYLRPANCVGVVDCSYRAEVKVCLHNDSDMPRVIEPQDRIAQLVVLPCMQCEFTTVNELDDTERGEGGFGSTGMK